MTITLSHNRSATLATTPLIPDFSSNYTGPMTMNDDNRKPRIAFREDQKLPPIGNGKSMRTFRQEYSTITPKEFTRIKQECSENRNSSKSKAEDERERLHKKSMESVKNWNNTILGQRRMRLEVQEQQKQKMKEENDRLEREWEEITKNEHDQRVAHARQLQYISKDRVRQLHSQLLVSNVLSERELQKAYKSKQKELERLRDVTEKAIECNEAGSSICNVLVQEELEKLAKSKQMKLDCSEYQRKQMKLLKDKIELDRQREKNFYKLAGNITAAMQLNGLINDSERNAEQAEIFKKVLISNEQQKKAHREMMKKQEELDDQANLRFNVIQLRREAMKKSMMEKRLHDRENIINHVGKIGQKEAKEHEEIRTRYLNKLEADEFNVRKAEQKEKDAKRALAQEKLEVGRSRKGMVERLQNAKRLEDEEKIVDRLRNEEVNRKFQEETKMLSERIRSKAVAIKEDQKRQMEAKERFREVLRLSELASKAELLKADQLEDEEFNQFAAALIREWHSRGKDVGPLMRALQGDNRARTYEFKKPLNTFERLALAVK